MSSDGKALFRAVCEQPWDDEVRLIYCDWLEENGQAERAEFIRLQLALAPIHYNQRFNLPEQRRVEALELKWDPTNRAVTMGVTPKPERAWSADLPQAEGVEWQHWYVRGFRSAVTFSSMKAVRKHSAAVV